MGEGVKYIITVAAYAATVSLLYSLSTAEVQWASMDALPTISILVNDYVKHLYLTTCQHLSLQAIDLRSPSNTVAQTLSLYTLPPASNSGEAQSPLYSLHFPLVARTFFDLSACLMNGL